MEQLNIRYGVIEKNNHVPKKVTVTKNQTKVIKDKYLKDSPTIEDWLRGVARNIALGELLHVPEFKQKILKGIEYDEKTFKFKTKKLKPVIYLHNKYTPSKERDKNFRKFMKNLYSLAEEDPKAKQLVDKYENLFYGMMGRWEFLPNSPTLMNAGRDLQQLSACYVLPIEDSVEGWGDTVKHTMLIHKSGGGTGFSGCRVRPSGSMVKTTRGVASGPLSVFKMVDAMTQQIKQGGTRRGANMGILPYWHSDIKKFITCKNDKTFLENFNISVAIDEKFMDAVKNNKEFDFLNPKDSSVMGKMNARELWDAMIQNAWSSGDPGFVVLDRINNSGSNPTPAVGQIESTNPCGEQPLLPYEPCNLGSINLSKFVIEGDNPRIDWDRLGDTAYLATNFLDNVIDVNNYPLPEIEEMAKTNRRIGLGVMGWAEMLSKLQIPYNSEQAFKLADEVMQFINDASLEASEILASERGVFPNWQNSIYDEKGEHFRGETLLPRNCARTTIAPTGTIGITAGLQGAGIEPFFAVVYIRYNAAGIDALKEGKTPLEEHTFFEVNSLFRRFAIENNYWGLTEKNLWQKIVDNHGTLIGISEIPEEVQKLFLTSHDLTPSEHVRVQAAFQKHTDNGVSKTVNLRNEATVDDVRAVYEAAYESGCKGVTIYRDGSKDQQVLNLQKKEETKVEKVDTEELAPLQNTLNESSAYYRLETGHGDMHIHINYNEKGPTKVFANIAPIGTEISGLTSAMGILLSKYFEMGGEPERILKHLNSVKGDKPHGFGAKRVDSIAHAFSIALKDHLISTGRLQTTQKTLNDDALMKYSNDLYCAKCFSANVAIVSGCTKPTCFDCGHSECG